MRLPIRLLLVAAVLSTILVPVASSGAGEPLVCRAEGYSSLTNARETEGYSLFVSGECLAGAGTVYSVKVYGTRTGSLCAGSFVLNVRVRFNRLVPAKTFARNERWSAANVLPGVAPFVATRGGTVNGEGNIRRGSVACAVTARTVVDWTTSAPDTPQLTPVVCVANGSLTITKPGPDYPFVWTIAGEGTCQRLGKRYSVSFSAQDSSSNSLGLVCAGEQGFRFLFNGQATYVDLATGKSGVAGLQWSSVVDPAPGLPFVIPFVITIPTNGAGVIVTGVQDGCWSPGQRPATFAWTQPL